MSKTSTYRLMKRNRRLVRAQRTLSAKHNCNLSLFTVCAIVGRAVLGNTCE